jgi:hypothetical protein
LGINLTSSDTRPIKATSTALEIIKADEKLIENSKTGKVTAIVAIMKIFDKKFGNSQNPNSGKLSSNSLTPKSCSGGEKKSDSYFQVGTYRVAGTINECVVHLENHPNHPKSQKRVHLPILYTYESFVTPPLNS